MPWREITPMSERLNMCRLAMEGEFNKSELARDFGVSRKTAYKWIDRYRREGDAGVFDRSRRPGKSPGCVSEDVVREVFELKASFPMWGPRKLHRLLEDRLGDAAPSKSTVARVLARAGLTDVREPSPRVEAVGRFERGEPNELWQTDFAAPFVLADGRKVWPLPVLDDHSRYCVSLVAAPDASGASALLGLRTGARRYGLPAEVLSDHGSAFGVSRRNVSAFTAYLWALGVEHTQGRYAHPQTQGKLERFNRTLERESIRQHCYTSLEDWGKCFEEYRQLYNQVRPHEALADDVPASHYKPSDRRFLEPDRHHREGGDGEVHRRVDASGKIWLLQHHVKVSNGLAGWIVAARHEGGGVWTVSFRGRTICQAQLAKLASYKPRP
jgi:transposase InsO family protein